MNKRNTRPAIIEGNIAKIPLGEGAKNGYALVDKEMAHLSIYSWHKTRAGYAAAWIDGKIVLMHHLILGKPKKGLVTDHINRVPLDNRLSNLRHITQSQNLMNRVGKLSKSKYKGVSWDKANKKWSVYVQSNGVFIWVGRFVDELEAALAYNQAASIHHGQYAILNVVERE